TKEHPCWCLECQKSFIWKSDLVTHYRIHPGEQPYKFLEFRQSFSKKSPLIKDPKIHTGERPYECPRCGKRF
ncbi:ZG49 protein, partial [Illadopsis cleaveri]|nr:ZG49 protein [Illadopsis cleaveri]